jgi:hypothetical protein
MDFDSSRIRMTINRPTDSLNADASGVSPSADLCIKYGNMLEPGKGNAFTLVPQPGSTISGPLNDLANGSYQVDVCADTSGGTLTPSSVGLQQPGRPTSNAHSIRPRLIKKPRVFPNSDIGRHMPRQRFQKGSLKKVGKPKKWEGRWSVYIIGPHGKEVRKPKKKFLVWRLR